MSQKENHISTGAQGESLAVAYLMVKGYFLLHRNWRCGHWEVDLIMHQADVLHFIEVKTRRNTKYGLPEESITTKKMDNLKRAAEEYLAAHPKWVKISFDVLSILIENGKEPQYHFNEDVYF